MSYKNILLSNRTLSRFVSTSFESSKSILMAGLEKVILGMGACDCYACSYVLDILRE